MRTDAGGPVQVAVIGAHAAVAGFALAGAHVRVAADDDAVRAAWESLPTEVGVVLLTPAAATALTGQPAPSTTRLTAVVPT